MKVCLTVDDSKVVRKAIAKMLIELNIEAREAENGKVALEECSKQKPDLILLDWNMPVMNGLEFIKVFRADKENDNIPVVFCTTENELEKVKEALSFGASEYIMKPFDIEILKGKLIQVGAI